MLVCPVVERHGHGCSPTDVVRFAEGGNSVTDRQRMTPSAMTAIKFSVFQSIAGFDNDEPIVDERQCRCVASRYIEGRCGLSVRNLVKCRTFDFAETKRRRSRDEKSFGHTRTWRNGRNRCGCEPDDGGRSMASRFSRRAHCRRLGGRGHPWRCARGPKAVLL